MLLASPKTDHPQIKIFFWRDNTVLELFYGKGGLAIGMEKAGLKCVALN